MGGLRPQIMKSNIIQRPLSPHLTIYQAQLTSILSIVHRGTGAMLAALCIGYFIYEDRDFVYGLAYNVLVGSSARYGSPASVREILAFAGRSFHFFNGVRHFLWDQGLLLNLKSVYSSGWVVVVLSTLLTRLFFMHYDEMEPLYRLWVGLRRIRSWRKKKKKKKKKWGKKKKKKKKKKS